MRGCRFGLSKHDVSSVYNLVDMVDKFASKLPLSIEVRQGYYGAESLLSEGDKYIIHCVKRNEVVRACDKSSKPVKVNVPLNSSFRFGVTYEKSLDDSEGTLFSGVHDIIESEILPRVVCVVSTPSSYARAGPSLEVNEVLVVQEVMRSTFGDKRLVVHSVSLKLTKILTDDIVATFSTKPSLVQLYLSEIVQHLPNPFPCHAILFQPEGNAALNSSIRVVESMLEKSVLLSERHTEVSLLATCFSDDAMCTQPQESILDIPVDGDMSDVKVQIISSSGSENLRNETSGLLSSFHLQDIKSLRDLKGGAMAKVQRVFRNMMRTGEERTIGISFESALGKTSVCLDGVHNKHSSAHLYEAIGGDVRPILSEEPKCGDSGSVRQVKSIELVSPLSTASVVAPSIPHRNLKSKTSSFDNLHSNSENEPVVPKSHAQPRRSKSQKGAVNYPRSFAQSSTNVGRATVVSTPAVASKSQKPKLSHPDRQNSDSILYQKLGTRDTAADGVYMDLGCSISEAPALHMPGGMLTPLQSDTPDFHPPFTSPMQQNLQVTTTSTTSGNIDHSSSNVYHELAEIRATMKSLSKRLDAIEKELRGGQVYESIGEHNAAILRNKQLLTAMTSNQILRLLDAMNLSQYKDAFAREKVDGELLQELDEEVLMKELGVISHIHCRQLIRLAKGGLNIDDLLPLCSSSP